MPGKGLRAKELQSVVWLDYTTKTLSILTEQEAESEPKAVSSFKTSRLVPSDLLLAERSHFPRISQCWKTAT